MTWWANAARCLGLRVDDDDDMGERLRRIEQKLDVLIAILPHLLGGNMATLNLDNLIREVEETKTAHAATKAALTGIVQKVRDLKKAKSLPEVQAQIDALAAGLDSSTTDLADAVVAGTAAADEEPTPDAPPPPDDGTAPATPTP
jgi:hypothetical protein